MGWLEIKDGKAKAKEIYNLANEIFFENKLPDVEIKLSNRMRTSAGVASAKREYSTGLLVRNSGKIKISIPYHEQYGWDKALEKTVLHETIHIWQYFRSGAVYLNTGGHGHDFIQKANEMGLDVLAEQTGDPNTIYCKALTGPARGRFVYKCINCGETVHKAKRLKRRYSHAVCNPYKCFDATRELILDKIL